MEVKRKKKGTGISKELEGRGEEWGNRRDDWRI